MKNSTKAQIAIFIIIGIAVLVATGLLYYIITSTAQQRSASQLEQQRLAAELVQPVDDYVTACLKATSQEALEMLGKQGGVIWKPQGGLTPDTMPSITYDNFKVAYGIKFSTGYSSRRGGIFCSDIPCYPRNGFPGIPGSLTATSFSGYFGNNTLPSSIQAMKGELENYILKKMPGCIGNWADFTAKGLKITETEGGMTVSALPGASDVSFRIDWPLTITSSTGQKVTKDSFVANQPVRLKTIFAFVETIVANETMYADFNISGKASDGITSATHQAESEKIVVVTDPTSRLAGKQFEFRFAMANRPAALHNIASPVDFCNDAKISFDSTTHTINITKVPGTPSPKELLIPVNATDPDGDTGLTYNASLVANYAIPQALSLSPKPLDFDTTIKVSVTDGKGVADYRDNINLIKKPCPA